MSRPATVSQLNRYIKSKLDTDERIKDLLLCGEISNFTNHYRSGHLYFVLKDAAAAVRAVMFRGSAQHLRFTPEDGMKVIVRCSVSLYERDGTYQVYVREMAPDGTGALSLAFEQLKKKLEQEGLFAAEHKRPLPRFPRVVGIVTSPTGAALQDMLNIIGRRFPLCRVVLSPATVQGAGAAPTLVRALRRLEELDGCDVIIIGRGGGSMEDLWAFNDEALARAVYACKAPVVSAVGHETDFTICDFTADLRAPTPSAAAELVVPDKRDISLMLDATERKLSDTMHRRLSREQARLELSARRVAAFSPQARLRESARRLESCRVRLHRGVRRNWMAGRDHLTALSQMVDSLSPVKTLSRGYALVLTEEGPVRSVQELRVGQTVRARFCDGHAVAQIKEIQNEQDEEGRQP